MSSKLFNVYAESEYLHILNHEWEWWIQARGQGRETLFAGVGAALHIMPSPHRSAHMLRRGRTMGTSQLPGPGQWMEEEGFSGNGSGKREEHFWNHLKVCLLSIRQWRRLQACNIGDVFRDLFIWQNADCPFETAIWTVKYGFVFAPTMPPF